ncbi:hypothetical protein [Neisseria sp. LACPHL-SPEC-2024-00856]|uniref:hypothetical protein n=1 Tax=Neisseria sp. LACPHL-SPEC-2024-00856 TaxID=3391057 RepID=UPI003A4D991E
MPSELGFRRHFYCPLFGKTGRFAADAAFFLRSFEKGKPTFQHTGRHIKRRPMKVKAYISIFYTPTEKNTMNCLLNLY